MLGSTIHFSDRNHLNPSIELIPSDDSFTESFTTLAESVLPPVHSPSHSVSELKQPRVSHAEVVNQRAELCILLFAYY